MSYRTTSNVLNFNFGENIVRVTDRNGDPWFIAKDVCDILGLENVTKALLSLDEDEKITLNNSDGNPRGGIPHSYAVISESGLYSLILRSRKPEAREFKRWVTHEVLPSIRKTGGYALEPLTSEGGIAALLEHNATAIKLLRHENVALKSYIDSTEPARAFGQAFEEAGTTFLVRDFIKMIPVSTGQVIEKEMRTMLIDAGELIDNHTDINRYAPSAAARAANRIVLIPGKAFSRTDGEPVIPLTARITTKGCIHYLCKFFGCEKNDAVNIVNRFIGAIKHDCLLVAAK